jgi:protein-disulfide isomerase
MRSRLSLLTLSGLALGTAILAAGTFVRPVSGQPHAAAQNGAAKSSGQSGAKPSSNAAAAQDSAAIPKRIEDYLRKYYAWGPNYQLKIGTPKQSPIGDLYEVPVEVSTEGGSDSAIVYVSKDGHYMVRGDMQDLGADPLAENMSKLNLQGAASKGPADAKVVLVEFGDLECPVCRQLDYILRAVLPKYPQVRLVFKDFPLESIHPWAMTASTTGRCVLQQSSDAFWKYHDAVYDNQDVISPENAYDKLTELAVQAGANPDKLKACVADPKTQDEVRQTIAEGKALGVDATPTTFVDGRRLVGPDQALLEQYIQYDSH